jgi:hypothetical protein
MSEIPFKNGNAVVSGGDGTRNQSKNEHSLDFSQVSDENGLRLFLAREAIQSGKVPDCAPDFLSKEHAEGEQCAVCGLSFTKDELGCKLEFARNRGDAVCRHLHIQCFAAWESECRNTEYARNGRSGPVDGKASKIAQDSGPGHGNA